MSIELLFKTLYCKFDAPTSTTTAESVATTFSQATGIVMKFECCDSEEYIKTLDMDPFSCYGNEEEHLIFETRLHIKDVWMPTKGTWIGSSFMYRLSLFDLLIHGNTIFNDRLLSNKTQKNLLKTLKAVINDMLSDYTDSSYVNALIKSLTQEHNAIWLNIEQILSLKNHELA
eukprot:153438_1